MLYVGGAQLNVTSNCPSNVFRNVELCIDEIRLWMRDNLLLLNDSKTDVVLFRFRFSQGGLSECPIVESLRIGDSTLNTTPCVKNLGVYFANHLTLRKHVKKLCQTASLGLYKIGKLRSYLDQSSTQKQIHAFVTAKIDYSNTLLPGVNDVDLKKFAINPECGCKNCYS